MAGERMINVGQCYACKTDMSLPEPLYLAAVASENITFYCAYGHGQHFAKGPTEADKLRQERDRLKQQIAKVCDDVRHQRERADSAERAASAYKGQATRLKNRAKAGVCPCCNRSFENLRRHMADKHPEFQETDNG